MDSLKGKEIYCFKDLIGKFFYSGKVKFEDTK